VTNIEPGLVDTELPDPSILRGMTPLTAEDVADAIAWCVANDSPLSVDNLVILPTDQSPNRIHRSDNG
jgi:3-hydroxy acid dehydrogenase / malonic semialdehyde reductase